MKPYYETDTGKLYHGDCIEVMKMLPEKSVQCCVTSPPYWGLRDYGVQGQLGLEETPELFVEKMVFVFREVWRVLRDDGILWLNLGDSYVGNQPPEKQKVLKVKDLIGIPWRVAFALQSDGWYLRQDIIWSKPNPMPESVKDRCTKAHEYIFLLSKNKKYHFDHIAIKEPAGDKIDTKQKSPPDGTQKKAVMEKSIEMAGGNLLTLLLEKLPLKASQEPQINTGKTEKILNTMELGTSVPSGPYQPDRLKKRILQRFRLN